jgi:CheY-like chemotaxis protein
VAHDFNNMLAVIVGRAQLLLRQVKEPVIRQQLQIIEQVAQDGAQTVRRIQEFARMRRTRPFQEVDLSAVVREVVEAARPRWSDQAQARGIRYEMHLDLRPVPPVTGDPAELRESLLNMLFNALDAMPTGGRVSFSTEVADGYVRCVVADTGVGMSEEVRQRCFEPFFTTKAEHGTGLGLSIAYGILTRHGGDIEAWSRPGEGSRFTLRLPVGQAAPVPAPPREAAPRRAGARILIVEDEIAVREVLVDLLAGRGHEIVACEDGTSAVARLGGGPFDLALLDLSMPGLSGWDVATRIRAASPRTPIVLITGWGDQIDPSEARLRGIDAVVPKPFDLEEVAAVVDSALARATRADA